MNIISKIIVKLCVIHKKSSSISYISKFELLLDRYKLMKMVIKFFKVEVDKNNVRNVF